MPIILTKAQFEKHLEAERRHMIRTNPPEVMDMETCAIFLERNADVLYEKVALGTIPYKKDGRRILFLRDPLREWLRGERKGGEIKARRK